MPTLPLYVLPATPDAWHRVRAPGGYEWWYFDAEDAANDIQIVGILFEGFVFHSGYLRRYSRYRLRPTWFAPPLPRAYPCAYFMVYRQGRVVAQFTTQYPTGEYEVSDSSVNVRIGPNTLGRQEDGSYRLHFEGVSKTHAKLHADLTFRPRWTHSSHERTSLSRQLAGAEHHWIIAAPLCDVQGVLGVGGVDGTIPFSGRGYHDHNYGTGPLAPAVGRWMRGRILLPGWAISFQWAKPCSPAQADEVHLVEADQEGLSELPANAVEADWSGRTKLGLAYPRHLRIAGTCALDRPRILSAGLFSLRLLYETEVDDQKASAFCEVAYPHRLLWPVVGRMTELSIRRP
jgi:carotenoid 1,2-hydratase